MSPYDGPFIEGSKSVFAVIGIVGTIIWIVGGLSFHEPGDQEARVSKPSYYDSNFPKIKVD